MALHHASPGEVVDVRPLGPALPNAISSTLVKTDRLQVFRYILRQGHEFTEHKVHGELTIQCLEGRVELRSPAGTCTLLAGELVHLASDDPHSLYGIEDASVLVTLVSSKAA